MFYPQAHAVARDRLLWCLQAASLAQVTKNKLLYALTGIHDAVEKEAHAVDSTRSQTRSHEGWPWRSPDSISAPRVGSSYSFPSLETLHLPAVGGEPAATQPGATAKAPVRKTLCACMCHDGKISLGTGILERKRTAVAKATHKLGTTGGWRGLGCSWLVKHSFQAGSIFRVGLREPAGTHLAIAAVNPEGHAGRHEQQQ